MGVKISDLPEITIPFSGGEKIPVVQSGVTRASNLSSFVNFLSGALLADSELKALSGAWQSNYTTTNSTSANWSSVYSTVCATSANWNNAYNAINNYSSNWARSYFESFDDGLEKYIYYGKDNAGFTPLFGPDGESWTRWFANFGTGILSGTNYDDGFQIYVNPNEFKKIYYDGTQYTVQSVGYLSNSRNWNSVYNTVSSLSAAWEESGEIVPTVTSYLSTNNVLLSSLTVISNGRVGSFALTGAGDTNANGTYYITNFTNASLGLGSTNDVVYAKNPTDPNSGYIIYRGLGPAAWYIQSTVGTSVYYNTNTLPWEGVWSIVPGRPSPPPTTVSASSGLNVSNNVNIVGSLLVYGDITARGYNSTNWQSTYTTMTASSANWNSVFSTVCALSTSWEESADIIPTVTSYLSTNNVLLSSATILNTLSARSYVNNPTGKTIYVDASVGNDTRNGFSKYDSFKPYRTLSAAIADSSVATGDLVYVRAGTYAISSQINLNLKGNLYFENGTTVNIASGIVAFSYSQNSVPITIRGYADFILATGATGVLTMPSGNTTTIVNFECSSIVNLTNDSSGTIFNCAAGVLGIDSRLIQAVAAPVFNITGTGKVTSRIPYVYCGVFLNGAGAANPGGATGAQINTDIWTLIAYNTTAGIAISSIATNFRMVNYLHNGVGVAYNWSENTTGEAHGFQGITWNSNLGQPNITFNSSAGSTTSKLIRLDQTNIMRYATTNSLSSNVPINVGTYGTFASVSATSNVTFKIGSFTVDTDVNSY
jgi:hypothetical protein